MRNLFWAAFLVLCFSCALVTSKDCDENFFVSYEDGDDANDCLWNDSSCSTIDRALELAEDIDPSLTACIQVYEGRYSISKPITRSNTRITGYKNSDVAIDCAPDSVCIDVRALNVTFAKIEFDGLKKGIKEDVFRIAPEENAGPYDFTLRLEECKVNKFYGYDSSEPEDVPANGDDDVPVNRRASEYPIASISVFSVVEQDPPVAVKIEFEDVDFYKLENVKIIDGHSTSVSFSDVTFDTIVCGSENVPCVSLHINSLTETGVSVLILDSAEFKDTVSADDIFTITTENDESFPFSISMINFKVFNSQTGGQIISVYPSNSLSVTMRDSVFRDMTTGGIFEFAGDEGVIPNGVAYFRDSDVTRINLVPLSDDDVYLFDVGFFGAATFNNIDFVDNNARILQFIQVKLLVIHDSRFSGNSVQYIDGSQLGFVRISQSVLPPSTLSTIENVHIFEFVPPLLIAFLFLLLAHLKGKKKKKSNVGDSLVVFDSKRDLGFGGNVKVLNDLEIISSNFTGNVAAGPQALIVLTGITSHASFVGTIFSNNVVSSTPARKASAHYIVGCNSVVDQIPLTVHFQAKKNEFIDNTGFLTYSPTLGSPNECRTTCTLEYLDLCGEEVVQKPEPNTDAYAIGVLMGWIITIGLMIMLASIAFVGFVFRKRIQAVVHTTSPQEVFHTDTYDSEVDAHL